MDFGQSNNLTAFNPEYWSKRMQVVRIEEAVYPAVANMEERATLVNGDAVHRPFRSGGRVLDYTKGTSVPIQTVTSTDESIVVNTTKIYPFYVDDLDEVQNKWDAASLFADDAGRELESFIDGDFQGEIVNANSVIDDGDISGTASSGNPIDLSTSNVLKVFAAAGKKLTNELKGGKLAMMDRYALIGPTTHQIIVEYLAGKDTNLSDEVGMNGRIGKFMGWELFMTLNSYWTGTWTPADNPSDGDTVSISGVTLTFRAAPTLAGEIDIGAATTNTLDNLAGAINNDGVGDGSDYVTLSDADLKTLTGAVATNNGGTQLDVTFEGGGEVAVANSEVNDPWSNTVSHLQFGKKKAIDIIVQQSPKVVFRSVQDQLGRNVLPWTLYGLKTFTEGKEMLVDVRLDSSQF